MHQEKEIGMKPKKVFLHNLHLLLDGFGIIVIGQIVDETGKNEMKYIYIYIYFFFFANSDKEKTTKITL